LYDNLPLRNIYIRQELINDAVNINSDILRQAVGTQGTVSNRLAQSINDDGTLKASAIDGAKHNIAQHKDGQATVSSAELAALTALGYSVSNPVPFVRMTLAERDKLSLMASEATAFKLQLDTPSNVVLFDDTLVF
jgi:Holliday junction resolvasome RuvABC DNA-binding subunit